MNFVLDFPIREDEESTKKWNTVPRLPATDPLAVVFTLERTIRESGFAQAEIVRRLQRDYGVEITASALSHVVRRGSMRLQTALQSSRKQRLQG